MNILHDSRAVKFTNHWLIYDYIQASDNPTIRLNAKYDARNVCIKNKHLVLQQRAFSAADFQAYKQVSVAGIQSKAVDMIHGTFRAIFKVEGSNGGSCASFFWYHNDSLEVDIEAVTAGTSVMNNTINYTSQPSLNTDGSKIPNATLSFPLSKELGTDLESFHEYRIDCNPRDGVKFFLDNTLKHKTAHNTPNVGGNLQLKLWADGNNWWSGVPSTTDVYMIVKSIIAYYNTSGTHSQSDKAWLQTCHAAGGPGEKTICKGKLNSRVIDIDYDSAVEI